MRSITQRSCVACGGAVEEGFLLDRRRGLQAGAQEWFEGEPVRSWLGEIRVRGRRRAKVVATRCRKCGHLALWAPERED